MGVFGLIVCLPNLIKTFQDDVSPIDREIYPGSFSFSSIDRYLLWKEILTPCGHSASAAKADYDTDLCMAITNSLVSVISSPWPSTCSGSLKGGDLPSCWSHRVRRFWSWILSCLPRPDWSDSPGVHWSWVLHVLSLLLLLGSYFGHLRPSIVMFLTTVFFTAGMSVFATGPGDQNLGPGICKTTSLDSICT